MSRRIALGAWLAMALLLVPGTSRARYLNVNTGRFQTMDAYQGNNEDPLSLHKYLYAADNPVDNDDPSGNDAELASLDFVGSGLGTIASFLSPVDSRVEMLANTVAKTIPIKSATLWAAYKQVDFETFKGNTQGQHQFWGFVGGSIGKWGDTGPQDSCASRMSWALNHAGAKIPSDKTAKWMVNDPTVNYKGRKGDGDAYIVAAWKMNRYLTDTYGQAAYQPRTAADIKAIRDSLPQGQVAIFASQAISDGHSGVLKSPDNKYKDPFVELENELTKNIQVWILSP